MAKRTASSPVQGACPDRVGIKPNTIHLEKLGLRKAWDVARKKQSRTGRRCQQFDRLFPEPRQGRNAISPGREPRVGKTWKNL
jgi:hypothetical protein